MDLGRDVLGYKIIKVANRKVSTWVNSKSIGYRQTSAAGIQTRELSGRLQNLDNTVLWITRFLTRLAPVK